MFALFVCFVSVVNTWLGKSLTMHSRHLLWVSLFGDGIEQWNGIVE